MSKSFVQTRILIMEEYLNFSLGDAEVWSPRTRLDPLLDFFTNLMMANTLLNVDPIKIRPNWRNIRVKEDRIAKRIDFFLVSESFVDGPIQIRQWVDNGGYSDHFPIFLEVVGGSQNPPSPFKFNYK